MPEVESKSQYLERLIEDQLSSTATDAKWYRRKYILGQTGLVVIGALITIVAGVKSGHIWMKENSTNILVILGASSTAWAAVGSLYSPQQSWQQNTVANNKLRALQAKFRLFEFDSNIAEKKGETIDDYFDKYQAILDERNQKWLNTRETAKAISVKT
jgi:hypothetical protein